MEILFNFGIIGNVNVVMSIMKKVMLMNIELVKEVANRVSNENSVILWNMLKKDISDDKANYLYALCYIMLEELESDEK